MRITYVLDTCVLIHDPHSFEKFPSGNVVIPIQAIQELDKLKVNFNEAGKNARSCVKLLDQLCQQGNISKGVKLKNGSLVKIETTLLTDQFGSAQYADNKILDCVSYLISKKKEVILVTRDINLRIRAQAAGFKAEDYQQASGQTEDIYGGFKIIEDPELGELLKLKGCIEIDNYPILQDLFPHQGVSIEGKKEGNALGRRIGNKLQLVKSRRPWGLEPRSKEQNLAADLILDPKIPLVTLAGPAGVGKSVLALAAALELVLERKQYKKLIIYRPIEPVGNDIGFLPGTLEEKLTYPYQAVYDTFEYLFSLNKGDKWRSMLDLYLEKEVIQLEAIAFIRGRSIPNALILVDECQNTSKNIIKTVLTRVSASSKIILMGDIEQIDNRSLSSLDNGLTYVVEAFKNSHLAGHMSLMKGERSDLATEAAKLLM